MPYRLLQHGEPIEADDQPLCDDCETWGKVAGWEVGMPYNPNALVPIRRFELSEPSSAFGSKTTAIQST